MGVATTWESLAEIVGKFDKNITRRGSVRETSTKKGNNYHLGSVMIGFFVFIFIGSSSRYNIISNVDKCIRDNKRALVNAYRRQLK